MILSAFPLPPQSKRFSNYFSTGDELTSKYPPAEVVSDRLQSKNHSIDRHQITPLTLSYNAPASRWRITHEDQRIDSSFSDREAQEAGYETEMNLQ